jgi:hypothetical protein
LSEPRFSRFYDYRDLKKSWQSFNPVNHGSDRKGIAPFMEDDTMRQNIRKSN